LAVIACKAMVSTCVVKRLVGVSGNPSVASASKFWKSALSVRCSACENYPLDLLYLNVPFSEACFKNKPKNLISLSPTGSLFLTPRILARHLPTSSLKSVSSYSWSRACLRGFVASKQHNSCNLRRVTTALRWPAFLRCASPKTEETCSRREVEGPSSGICTAKAELRVELARDLSVWVDDFRDTVASEERFARFARTEVRPGIFAVRLRGNLCVAKACCFGCGKQIVNKRG
jgi:hypothetical protein